VTRWIKDDEELKSIPVIAVTAFAMKGDEEKNPARRMRGLSLEADFGLEIPRNGKRFPGG
jgi:CheY-like chemotaxis protein